MKITIELSDEIAEEFKELPKFWVFDEEDIIKPTIQETLKKYIIDNINERRLEIASAQSVENTNLLKEEDIL